MQRAQRHTRLTPYVKLRGQKYRRKVLPLGEQVLSRTHILGAIFATMVPDSKKMDMPHVVAGTSKRVRDLGYERFCSSVAS